MRICFDAQPLIDSQKTGIGFYQTNIMKALIQTYGDHQYVLNYFSFRNKEVKRKRLEAFEQLGVALKDCRWFPERLYRFLWNFIPISYRLFFPDQADMTQFFNYHVPPGVKGKRIATVHDMAYKVYPETVRFKTKFMLNLSLRRSCRRADHIITISQFSKGEIVKHLGISAERISVVPCGVDTELYRPIVDAEVDAVLKKYVVSKPYFLYLGTLEPRKNIERMIEAYAKLLKERPDAPPLVLAGRKGWLYDAIFQKVKTFGIERNVVFTGYVDGGDAPALYSGALAFLFPSLYEGFGMPPLEAMACGTPVLTANVSSLPEVVGDAALLVDPYRIDDISRGMQRLIDDEGLRRELIARGFQRLGEYTWERAAKRTFAIYQRLCGGN